MHERGPTVKSARDREDLDVVVAVVGREDAPARGIDADVAGLGAVDDPLADVFRAPVAASTS
jgi:hypothetical protein